MNGLSMHAAMRCGADERNAQLCRCVTRQAVANQRLEYNAAEQVVLKRKTPWQGDTKHLVMPPLGFRQRLAALVVGPLQPTTALFGGCSIKRQLCGDEIAAVNVD